MEWVLEDSTGKYRRNDCNGTGETECGTWYLNMVTVEEVWVTCEMHDSWENDA